MIGIGQHSYSVATWRGDSGAKFSNALTFLEYAQSIGAAETRAIYFDLDPDEAHELEQPALAL